MPCDHSEHFTVKVHVAINRGRGAPYGNPETISYTQEFTIPATGFTGVAKILGDLDQAIGSIHKCKELP
jgi:hypothetical protein